MGPVKGMIVNVIAVAWIIFAIVFFSFPYYKPVTGMFLLTMFDVMLMICSCKYELYLLDRGWICDLGDWVVV